MTRPPTTRVAAQPPLLRCGLERLARDAGVEVTTSSDADFVLRSVGVPSAAGVDVVVDDGVVVITCRSRPDARIWGAVLRVVEAGIGGDR